MCFEIEQRVIREAIARNNQIREIFADLDTNGDLLYVLFYLKSILYFFLIEFLLMNYKNIQNLIQMEKMNLQLKKFE